MLQDQVLWHSAAVVLGEKALEELTAEHVARGENIEAAKSSFALAELLGTGDPNTGLRLMKQAHAMLEKMKPLTTEEGQQLGECAANGRPMV